MKVKLLLYNLILISLLAFPAMAVSDQGGGDINKIDSKGRKQGKWVFFGKDRPESGYPEDGKIEEGPFKDDRKEGLWTRYHMDGVTPKLEGVYSNNLPSGRFIKRYPNGKIREAGIFIRGKYQDSLKRYREDGTVEYEGYYNEDGKEQGPTRYYYPNGQIELIYTSQGGVPTGKATRYYENGDVKEIIYYDEQGKVEKREEVEMVNASVTVVDPGVSKEKSKKIPNPRTKGLKFQPNDYNKVYNENDEIWQDGEFKSGRLWDGKIYEYDQDGILLKVRVFKKGLYHSDGQL